MFSQFIQSGLRKLGLLGDKFKAKPGQKTLRRNPIIEALEDRCMMSATALPAAPAVNQMLATPSTPRDGVQAIAEQFTHSPEYYTKLVTDAYQHYLGRAPDAAGLKTWVGAMQQGMSDEQLEANVLASAEYFGKHGGAGPAWLGAVYQDALNRSAETAGRDFWAQGLAAGLTPNQVAYRITSSAEREGQRIVADYQALLGRHPSPAELSPWVDQVMNHGLTNEDVMARMGISDEYLGNRTAYYYAQHNLQEPAAKYTPFADASYHPTAANNVAPAGLYLSGNSSDWLAGLYHDMLGRDPDLAGMDHWTGVLWPGQRLGPNVKPAPALENPPGGIAPIGLEPIATMPAIRQIPVQRMLGAS